MFYSPLYLIDWLNFLFEIISNKVIEKFQIDCFDWIKCFAILRKKLRLMFLHQLAFLSTNCDQGIERLKKANISTCRSLALCRKCLQKQFYLHCKQTEVLVKAFYFCKFLNLLYIVFVWEWQWQCFWFFQTMPFW